MEFNELRAGMRVELRGGSSGVVVISKDGNINVIVDTMSMANNYNTDMTHLLYKKRDIMKVWASRNSLQACDLENKYSFEPVWEREEVKEMTVS